MYTLVNNIKRIYGVSEILMPFKKGSQMSMVNTVEDAYLLIYDGKIMDWGQEKDYSGSHDRVIDAQGGLLMPTWCDSHTHIVFAASREGEYLDRLKGKSYEEIAEAGGGILNSAKKLRSMSEDDLYQSALTRLYEVISYGTGAIEIKSGYGLTVESEIKMLRVIKRLKAVSPIPIKANFLGAHAIPLEFKYDRQKYIDIIINEMLPRIAEEQLADYCDVFCDKGFFTVQETSDILEAAWKYGLKPKIHANELANSGGVQVGVAKGAISVDHLEMISEREIEVLLNSETIPTVLPSCSFFLNIEYAPARQMIDAGLGIAMATDYNPGSSPSGNIPLLMALACNKMRVLPYEAFNSVTVNGAYAMEVHKTHGSIEVGKAANFIITKPIPSLDYMIYGFGTNHIDRVVLNGEIFGN